MGSDPKGAPRTAVELDIPQTAAEREAAKLRPIVGSNVWYFDQTQNGAFSRMGEGPYAAVVTRLDATGVSLFVIGPQGGRFDREKILHRSQLGDGPGKRQWWEWPTR